MKAADRVRLGRTAVEVTRLGIGCAPIGNLFEAVDDGTATATIRTAYEAGLRLFDTAPLYGHGLSEQRLGAALATLPRDEVVVATKVGRVLVEGTTDTIFVDAPRLRPEFDFSADGVHRSLDASLARLGLDRVDIVHVHDPDDHVDEALAGAFPALRRWREEGVVGAIGAGMNQAPVLARFVREADVDCVLVAGRYTLLDTSAADELLPLCADRNVAVIAAGVFNSGVLADPDHDHHFFYADAPAAVVERAKRLANACADRGVSLRAAALQFPTTSSSVACVLTGVRSPEEVTGNVADFERPLPDDLWAELRTGS